MLKILCIGNSFSEDATAHLSEIAKSAGVSLTVGNLVIGGCTLDTHLNNVLTDAPAYFYDFNQGEGFVRTENKVAAEIVRSEAWDVITLQQASSFSGKPNSYEALSPMLSKLRELCPTAKLFWHMTWAYQQDSLNPAFSEYGNSQEKMYADILSAVKARVLTERRFSGIIPNGTAVQNARGVLGDNLTRDGFHLSFDLGRYIAALTYFAVLAKGDLYKVTFLPEGVSKAQAEEAKRCVLAAIENPFTVTVG